MKFKFALLGALLFCSTTLMSAELNAGKFSAYGLSVLNQRTLMTDASGKVSANADVKYPFFIAKDGSLNVHLLVKADEDAVAKFALLGAKIITHTKTVYAITIPVDAVGDISQIASVSRIEPGKMIKAKLDVSKKAINADSVKENKGLTANGLLAGDGVVVGVVDTGLDLTHPDFFDEKGSRILYYWDMSVNDATSYPTAEGYKYGKEYTKAKIDADTASLSQTDPVGHGTHVAGTAAGSGTVNSAYRGVAYKANIIGVKCISDDQSEGMTDENIIAGCEYIIKKAKALGEPCVINLSLGENFFSASDGTDLSSVALNEASGPGVIFSVSAGNEGMYPVHEGIDMTAGTKYTFPILAMDVSDYIGSYGRNNSYSIANIWYDKDGLDSLVLGIYSFNYQTMSVSLTATKSLPIDGSSLESVQINNNSGETVGYLTAASVTEDKSNGDANLMMYIGDGGQRNIQINGQLWTISAYPKKDARLDLWGGIAITKTMLQQYQMYSSVFNNMENVVYCDGKQTLASPGLADSAICVGSFNTKTSYTNYKNSVYSSTDEGEVLNGISVFSSIGPRRDGVMKPDILAPGSLIIAPMSKTISSSNLKAMDDYILANKKYIGMEGTSMAAPHVTGSVALLLEIDPTLTAYQIQQILHRTAKVDSFTGECPNISAGWGKIDVQAAVNAVLAGSGVDYVNVGDTKVYPLPATANVNIVLNSAASGRENLSVFDESGRAVSVPFQLNGSELNLNVSQLASGVYSGAFGSTKFKFMVK